MRRAVAAGLLLALAACSGGGGAAGVPTTVPPAPAEGPAPLYISVGASETTGIGSETPLREAWPQLLFRRAMPGNTIFVNMGIPGATVQTALRFELTPTVDQKPTVVTVWLNVNDIIAGVSAADYERDLGNLVRQLRRGGQTRVLVANTPPIDHLPAYKACRPDPPANGPECRAPGGEMPPPDEVNRVIDEYNVAVARIADREGASLVDLHAVGMRSRAAGIEDALISPDGFHPNAGGYQLVATAFAEVLQKTGPL